MRDATDNVRIIGEYSARRRQFAGQGQYIIPAGMYAGILHNNLPYLTERERMHTRLKFHRISTSVAAEAAPAGKPDTGRWRQPIPHSTQAELLQFPVERALTDAQRVGNLPAVAIVPAQQVRNMLRLDILQRGP